MAPELSRRAHVILWIITGLLAANFLFAGGGKFADPDTWRQEFEGWGYPANFAFVIAAVEVAAAALLLWPRTTPYAAAVLGGDMMGAAVTHVVHAEWPGLAVALVLGSLCAVVAWGRRPEWVRERLGQGTPA